MQKIFLYKSDCMLSFFIFVRDRIGSSLQHVLNGYNLVTTSTLGLAPRLAKSDAIMLQRTSHSHLQYSHLQSKQDSSCISTSLMFYVSYGCWPTYFNLVGVEEDIANERFKWSRASTFSHNRNAIGLAVAYTSAIRTHLLPRFMAPLTP